MKTENWRNARQVMMREYAASKQAAKMDLKPSLTLQELEERRAMIPEDTRTITGRVFGDPLPGRSALDMRGYA